MANWVRHSTLGVPIDRWMVSRLPYGVRIKMQPEMIFRVSSYHLVGQAIAWCDTNIGESCFRYIGADRGNWPSPKYTNLDGLWGYRLYGMFHFREARDATAFKLVWA